MTKPSNHLARLQSLPAGSRMNSVFLDAKHGVCFWLPPEGTDILYAYELGAWPERPFVRELTTQELQHKLGYEAKP